MDPSTSKKVAAVENEGAVGEAIEKAISKSKGQKEAMRKSMNSVVEHFQPETAAEQELETTLLGKRPRKGKTAKESSRVLKEFKLSDYKDPKQIVGYLRVPGPSSASEILLPKNEKNWCKGCGSSKGVYCISRPFFGRGGKVINTLMCNNPLCPVLPEASEIYTSYQKPDEVVLKLMAAAFGDTSANMDDCELPDVDDILKEDISTLVPPSISKCVAEKILFEDLLPEAEAKYDAAKAQAAEGGDITGSDDSE